MTASAGVDAWTSVPRLGTPADGEEQHRRKAAGPSNGGANQCGGYGEEKSLGSKREQLRRRSGGIPSRRDPWRRRRRGKSHSSLSPRVLRIGPHTWTPSDGHGGARGPRSIGVSEPSDQAQQPRRPIQRRRCAEEEDPSSCMQALHTHAFASQEEQRNCGEANRYAGPLREGSTACVVIITENQIVVGNLGDSRCVLSHNGQVLNLSTDHKPNTPRESQRIQRAGGQVVTSIFPVVSQGETITRTWDVPRVEKKLPVSRAIGYFELKQNKYMPISQQMVICAPELVFVDITDDMEFLVIANKGIWSYMSSQQVVDFVHKELRSGEENLRATCEKLLDECVNSGDNLTAILVRFKPGATVIPLLSDIEEEPDEPQHDPQSSGQQHASDEIEAVPSYNFPQE